MKVTVLAVAFALTPGAPPETTAEVVALARERQDAVKSFEVKLRQTDTLSPGAMATGNKAFPPVPKERTVLTSEPRLVVGGSNFRHEYDVAVEQGDGTLGQRRYLVASDGTATRMLLVKGPSGNGEDVGVIRPAGRDAAP